MPLDRHARDIDYLRISVIDACNLRCSYCMPMERQRFLPNRELLTPDEIRSVAEAAVDVGFTKFRLTGGEPTLRRDIEEIVRAIKSVPGSGELSMTTNGLLLPQLGAGLRAAGLDRVNLHIDTLDDDHLRQVMKRSDLDRAWAGIEAAEQYGFIPIKLNTVVVKGENDADVVQLAELTRTRPWHVRFIELMPLGGGDEARYSRDKFVATSATKEVIQSALGALRPLTNASASDESRNFRLEGGEGVIGFISPVSEPFCGTCNRMRLTPDGKFHLCLLKNNSLDVRKVLRESGSAAELRDVLLRAVGDKPIGHALGRGESNTSLAMHQIGG